MRDKGPIFMIYPFDTQPELNTEKYYSRSVLSDQVWSSRRETPALRETRTAVRQGRERDHVPRRRRRRADALLLAGAFGYLVVRQNTLQDGIREDASGLSYQLDRENRTLLHLSRSHRHQGTTEPGRIDELVCATTFFIRAALHPRQRQIRAVARLERQLREGTRASSPEDRGAGARRLRDGCPPAGSRPRLKQRSAMMLAANRPRRRSGC